MGSIPAEDTDNKTPHMGSFVISVREKVNCFTFVQESNTGSRSLLFRAERETRRGDRKRTRGSCIRNQIRESTDSVLGTSRTLPTNKVRRSSVTDSCRGHQYKRHPIGCLLYFRKLTNYAGIPSNCSIFS